MQKKILAVDDDVDILQMLKLLLDIFGYEVVATLSGHEVFDKIAATHPDLVLMDITLGGIDGRDISRKLKENPETRAIPVILISALPITRPEVMACGANDFLNKPFDIFNLKETIEKNLPALSA